MLCWQVGWYVTLHVCNVPVSVMESFKEGKPLVLFSLLPHEQKVTKLGSVDSLCVCSSSCDSPDGLERFWLQKVWAKISMHCLHFETRSSCGQSSLKLPEVFRLEHLAGLH